MTPRAVSVICGTLVCLFRVLLATSLLLLLSTGLSARVEPLIKGPDGKLINAPIIQPGITTREEVLHDWGWSDTHIDSDHLFVGSMLRSTERGNLVETLGRRLWETQNLFIEFDDKNVVTKSYFVRQLSCFLAMKVFVDRTSPPPLDLAKPVELKTGNLNGTRRGRSVASRNIFMGEGTMVLAGDSIEFIPSTEFRPFALSFRVGIGQLKKLRYYDSWVSLEFTGMQHGETGMRFLLGAAETFLFIRYLREVAPALLAHPKGPALRVANPA